MRAILWLACVLSTLVDLPGGSDFRAPAPSIARAALLMPAPSTTASAPRAAIAPDAGPPASSFTLVGSGFPTGKLLTIAYVDMQNRASTLGVAAATANGDIEATNLTIPASAAPGGIGLIVVRAAQGGGALSSTPFAVTPLATNLVAAPNVTMPGGTVILSGGGLQPRSAVQLQVLTADGPVTVLGTEPLTSTGTGAIGPLAITIPLTLTVERPTWAAINVADTSGAVAGIPLTLLPASGPDTGLRLQPARAVLGARVRVAASGFSPGEEVGVTLIGASGVSATVSALQAPSTNTGGAATGAALIADSNGSVDGLFAVPPSGDVVLNDAPGTVAGDAGTMLLVSLHGMQSGITRTAPLLLSAPHVQLLPTITTPGHGYSVLGSGFASGEQVRVLIADSSGASALVGYFTAASCGEPAAIPADSGAAPGADVPGSRCVSGSFVAIATAPTPAAADSSAAMTYSVSATGAVSGLATSSTLILTNAPTLTLQRYVVAPGQSIMVQGNAFAPNATVTIQAAFPPRGASGCASGGATAPRGAQTGPCTLTMVAATGGDGAFTAQITIPLTARDGPVTIQAQDKQGDQAGVVLTVTTQPPALHLPELAAYPGQVVTIRGGGFASGETVDVSLAVPSSPGTAQGGAACGAVRPQLLPNSTLTTTADALGSFTIAYPLPEPFTQGTYYVEAIGETSNLCAFDPISVENQTPTPLPTLTPCTRQQCRPAPTPTATTATPVGCDQEPSDAQTSGCASDTVIYFAEGSTAQIATDVQAGGSYPGIPCPTAAATPGKGTTPPCVPAIISFQEDVVLLNESDQPVSVDIAYFLYGVASSQLRAAPRTGQPAAGWITPSGGGKLQVMRRRTLVLPPRAAIARSVNADIGDGHLVSIIVRAPGSVIASTLSRRTLLVEGCAARSCKKPCSATRPCSYDLDAASSDGSGPAGPQTTWLFAQGYLGGAFSEYLSLLNPQTDPAIVQVRILTPKGVFPRVLRVDVPAGGRQGIDVDGAIQTLCTPRGRGRRAPTGCPPHDGPIGLQLSSTEPIVAERTLLWGAGNGPTRAGYDVGAGAPAIVTRNGAPVAGTQYLPYASTLHGDQAFLALLDPTIHPAAVTVSAYSTAGMHLADKTIVVPAQGCAALSLAGMVLPGIYALIVRSATPVTGELAQYGGGSPQEGAHAGFVEPLSSAQPAGGSALLSGGARAQAGAATVWVFNAASRRVVARVSVDTATGWSTLAQYQIAAHATLQSMIPVNPSGKAAALGITVACSGPCAGLALGAGTAALWSDALR